MSDNIHPPIHHTLRQRLRHLMLALTDRLYIFKDTLNAFSAIASVVALTVIAYGIGFDHTDSTHFLLRHIYITVAAIFITTILARWLMGEYASSAVKRGIMWTALRILILLLLALDIVPIEYLHIPKNCILIIGYLSKTAMATFALLELSYLISSIFSKKVNPAQLMCLSFLLLIFVGTTALSMPKCTYTEISLIDALFVSTSAVSITGLTPIDIAEVFTPTGLIIIAILIESGAIGLIIFTSFFATFYSGEVSIHNQLALRDMISSKSLSTIGNTIRNIIATMLLTELVGAIMIFSNIHGLLGQTLKEEIITSAFHSVSAFANAGFSNIHGGMTNSILLTQCNGIYWVMTLLIITGSLGFPVIINISEVLKRQILSITNRGKRKISPHILSTNTQLVLYTTGLLYLAAAVLFFVLEYDGALSHMDLWQKITQSVFNSAVPRSAGFESISPASFTSPILFMTVFLMWVGGASQSTGGGIKVNTLGVVWLNVVSLVRGRHNSRAFGRRINIGSIRRANAVVTVSIISYAILSFLILGIEKTLPAKAILFESLSALFTVGSSIGITQDLSAASKILLCIAMLVGRVGILSLLSGIVRHDPKVRIELPSERITIT